jgi:hypothetical protein
MMIERRKTDHHRKRLVILQGVTALLAVMTLIYSVVTNQNDISQLQQERVQSRLQVCYLLRGLVITATPLANRDQIILFINQTPLHNCREYSEQK